MPTLAWACRKSPAMASMATPAWPWHPRPWAGKGDITHFRFLWPNISDVPFSGPNISDVPFSVPFRPGLFRAVCHLRPIVSTKKLPAGLAAQNPSMLICREVAGSRSPVADTTTMLPLGTRSAQWRANSVENGAYSVAVKVPAELDRQLHSRARQLVAPWTVWHSIRATVTVHPSIGGPTAVSQRPGSPLTAALLCRSAQGTGSRRAASRR